MYISKVYQAAVDSYGDVRTLVRGLPYQCPNDWENVLDSLDEDSDLYLVKEPDNPKDKMAIAAYLGERRVGYVAASDNGKIWLYLTDEKMPCTFIERFEASFKIAFENPRSQFEGLPFEIIYKDKDGVTEEPYPAFEIPFLNYPKDSNYVWFDDKTYIMDLEKFIPDFRRKLASRMIVFVGRKNSKGEYCYYLPYANNIIVDVEEKLIQDLIDRYGFVIALPDVPSITERGSIFMDLHVTYLEGTNYKVFDSAHQSELVFSFTKNYNRDFTAAMDKQSISVSDKVDNSCQNVAMEGSDLPMHTSQSTPSYSKSDYILKKGEVTTYSIDKNTFTEIDKIVSELYSFVRQTLFQSMELFSYLKKHTPYYSQFNDIGQFEALIRVLVIKDIGRIYKGLNHSFNFETAEGKALFLYMEKDAGENSESSYETFNEICNPNSQLEAASKMREAVENLMKSFYEYDIPLWTDTDFIIHSFLKDLDKELAKHYLELMCQFASAVEGANDQSLISPAHSVRGSSSTIDEFFPLFGITLGKTTWKDVEDMGYVVEIWDKGPDRCADVHKITFWDHDGEGVFTSLFWFYHYIDFPSSWKSKGFSWDNSFDEWMKVFNDLGFSITVTKQPSRGEFCGSKTLSAVFEALSPDCTLLFKMNFENGEEGYYTSSPKTLEAFSVSYKGAVTSGSTTGFLETDEKTSDMQNHEEEYYSVSDSPEGGKHVSMGVIIPEDGDEDFDFCSYNCTIRDKDKIDVITRYMKRYEAGHEPRPFLMIGRPLLGTSDMYIFYSLDGEIIFDFIFDDKIKSWIREAGFVLGKVKEYHFFKLTESLDLTLSVSKRKCGEALFKQASEEAMDYIEEYTYSSAEPQVEEKIIKAVEDSTKPYQVLIRPKNGVGICTTLDGEEIATMVDDEIIELAEQNKGVLGYITNVDYEDDGEFKYDVWFTIKVSRSIPKM